MSTLLSTSAPEHAQGDDSGSAHRTPRIAGIDVLRGVAILAVIWYHLMWDLGDLDLIDVHISRTGWGDVVAHCIVSTFMLLVGASLVLAHGRGVRVRAFWRREAELLAYGMLISAVTLVIMRSQWVSFGILQCIAVVSVLCLPFVRASRLLSLGAGGLCLVVPHLVTIPGDSRWLSWTGLTESVQPTIDHAPLLPWLGVALLGVAAMQTLVRTGMTTTLARWKAQHPPASWLRFLGRHTLVIYLVHQPVLLAALNGWVALR